MRQKTLLMPTLREAPSDAEAASHILLLRGGYMRQLAAGVYSYLPLGWRVLNRLSAIIREEMDRACGQEMLMPALQPAELWRESGRYDCYGPELVRLADRHQREFVLGPTHEEVITAIARDELVSYRQLPALLYQIQTKFRDERRPRFGLLRSREFLMKDAYSFALDNEGLDEVYRRMHAAYEAIFKRCGLEFRAVEADAGAIGGDGQTHEFMALAPVGEDTVVTCSCCGYAANLEVAHAGPGQDFSLGRAGDFRNVVEGEPCPRCGKGALKFRRGIEVGHVFKLGTRYSRALGAALKDSKGRDAPLIMGCYGIGISRLMAALAEQNHDDRGIAWPAAVAPFQAHIIPVSAHDSQQLELAEDLYRRLKAEGIETLLDDRQERPGVKFKDSDLIGIPWRIVAGKEAGAGIVELSERRTGRIRNLPVEEAVQQLLSAAEVGGKFDYNSYNPPADRVQ